MARSVQETSTPAARKAAWTLRQRVGSLNSMHHSAPRPRNVTPDACSAPCIASTVVSMAATRAASGMVAITVNVASTAASASALAEKVLPGSASGRIRTWASSASDATGKPLPSDLANNIMSGRVDSRLT